MQASLRGLVLSLWLCWFTVMMVRYAVPPVLPLIEDEFGLTHAQAGLLMTGYFASYASLQIPAGFLADLFRRKFIIVFGLSLSCAANFLIGFTNLSWMVLTLRLLSGVGGGMFYAPSSSLIADLIDTKVRTKALGESFSGIPISLVVTFLTAGYLSVILNWRWIFYVSLVPGIVSNLSVISSVREGAVTRGVSKSGAKEYRRGFLELLKNRAYVALMSADFCLLLVYAGIMSFIPTFLVITKGVDILLANLLYMLTPSTGVVGMLTGGIIASRIGNRRALFCFLSSVFAGILLFTFRQDLTSLTTGVILFGYGVFSTFPLMTNLVIATTSSEVRGVSLGVFNFLGMVGSAIGPVAIGYFADVSSFYDGFVFAMLMLVGYLILISINLYKFQQDGDRR